MSCDAWKRTDEKIKQFIGSTNPFLAANDGTGSMVRNLEVMNNFDKRAPPPINFDFGTPVRLYGKDVLRVATSRPE